jgi:chromosome segregation ATPase
MLDAFKKGHTKPAQQQAVELQALIATSKEERAALSTMLTQIQLQASKLSTAGKNLQDVESLVGRANDRLDQVSERLEAAEARSRELAAIDARIAALVESVSRAEGEAGRLLAPEGDLQQHRQAIEGLASQAAGARDALQALREEHRAVERIRTDVRDAAKEAGEAGRRASAVQADVAQLLAVSSGLSSELAQMQQLSSDSRAQAAASAAAVQEVERRLESLAQLQETSRHAEERLAALNALAEHVSQKIKTLENQKHTVERAVVESNRLNDMIWSMELQIKKLDEAARQATATEELVERVEKTTRDVTAQLDAGLRAREEFAAEIQRLEQSRGSIADLVRAQTERLAVERRELAGFDERVKVLQGSIAGLEGSLEGLAKREAQVTAIGGRVDQLSRDVGVFGERAEAALASQTALDTLQDSLARVDELTRSTAARFDALTATRQQAEGVRQEIEAIHQAHADVVRLRDSAAADRAAMEAFIQRASAFAAGLPELQSRIEAVDGRLTTLDDVGRKVDALAAAAGDLEARNARLAGQRGLIDQIEHRLTTLSQLAADTDRRLEDQHARSGEIDAIRSRIDGISLKAAEAGRTLDDVSAAQARLSPVVDSVAMLQGDIERAQERLEALQISDATVAKQEGRLTDVLARSEAAAAAAAERLVDVQGLAKELERSAAVKESLLMELSRAEARQRDVAVQMQEAEEQLQRLQAGAKETEQRRRQIAAADKRLAAFQGRLDELQGLTSEVERRIEQLTARETVLDAVRQQVDAVHEITSRSRTDLEYVESHRNDVSALRERVDDLLASIADTESRLASIQGRRQLVDEVQVKTSVILNMLEDVRLNVETLGEQRAIMDHALESCGRLGEMVREAQSTMKALQTERELAERIQRGIKQLRARTPGAPEKKKPA